MFSFDFILASVMLVACLNGQDIPSTQCNCDDDMINALVECRLKQVLENCASAGTSFKKEPKICASTISPTSSTTTTSSPTSSTKTSPPRNCTGDWKQFRQSCYLIEETSVNFTTAVARCNSSGGYLAEIEDDLENSYLQKIVKRDSAYYIGLNDIKQEGTFSWFGTNRLLSQTGYSRWGNDQPNSIDDEQDCVMMDGSGYWDDVSCTDELNPGYICEIKKIAG